MLKVNKYNVRIVRKGDRYGRDDCLTHDDDRPVVEFYDSNYPTDDGRGGFVSRYYVGTLLGHEGFYGGDPTGGLCLDGGQRNTYTVSDEDMHTVRTYIQEATR
jgi:hypothetical protein